METHVYTVDAINSGDTTYISGDNLRIIMELENIKIVQEPKPFRKLVSELWADSIMKGSYPQNDPDAIMIKTENATFYYDAKKIIKNQHWILLYLNQLHVLDPRLLADGTRWTELKQPIELLMSMGHAVVECIQKNNKIVR